MTSLLPICSVSWSRRGSWGRALRCAAVVVTAVYCGIAYAGEAALGAGMPGAPVTFVFTSDVHFGIARGSFRGAANVESRVVNAAMVAQLNRLPTAVFPADGGVRAGQAVGPVDFGVITGDLTNRQELYPLKIQSASISWGQFAACYLDGFALKNARGEPAPLLLVPGNHDVSNAIGAPSKLVPETDATTLAEIYNRMVKPDTQRTKETYRFATDRIIYARDFGGAHAIFLSIWPDSGARAWIEADLKHVPETTPVFIFCHDPPAIEARHFTNPHGKHDVNDRDKFENVVLDVYSGEATAESGKPDGSTKTEQRALATFLKAHRNIVAYFHGHSNWTEFYTWKGPDGDLALPTFRSDSPMKGKVSGKDETKLAFQVVVYDVAAQKLTARECLWNTGGTGPDAATAPLVWGESITVSIAPASN